MWQEYVIWIKPDFMFPAHVLLILLRVFNTPSDVTDQQPLEQKLWGECKFHVF